MDKALLAGQSPQAIAGRLKAGLEPSLSYVSRDTIETYIRSAHGRRIEYELKLLKLKQYRKRSRNKPSLPLRVYGYPKVYIDDRPSVITTRARVGDLEVDFIVSGKAASGYALTAGGWKSLHSKIRK